MRAWAARLGSALLLAGLAGACVGHYGLALVPLPAEKGWAQLPVQRWLLDPGIRPELVMFCPRENCAGQADLAQGLVARLTLDGHERGAGGLLARDPERFARLAVPPPSRATGRSRSARTAPPRRGPTSTAPLAIGPWRGAVFSLLASGATGRAAHVAAVATPEGGSLMLAVAEDAAGAEALLRTVLE